MSSPKNLNLQIISFVNYHENYFLGIKPDLEYTQQIQNLPDWSGDVVDLKLDSLDLPVKDIRCLITRGESHRKLGVWLCQYS